VVKPFRVQVVEVGSLAHGIGRVDEGVLVNVIPPGQSPVETVKSQETAEGGYQQEEE